MTEKELLRANKLVHFASQVAPTDLKLALRIVGKAFDENNSNTNAIQRLCVLGVVQLHFLAKQKSQPIFGKPKKPKKAAPKNGDCKH